MTQAFLSVIFILTALIGITEIIHKILIFLIAPKNYCDYITVLLHKGTALDSLKTAIQKFNLEGSYAFKKVIAVDCGIDSQILQQVLQITAANDNVVFCSLDNLNDTVQQLKENNFG